MKNNFKVHSRRYDVACCECGTIVLENATLTDAKSFIASRDGTIVQDAGWCDPADLLTIAAHLPKEDCACEKSDTLGSVPFGWRVAC